MCCLSSCPATCPRRPPTCDRSFGGERVADAVDSFLVHLRAIGRSAATIATYERELDRLAAALAAMEMGAVHPDDIDRVLVALSGEAGAARSEVTLNRIRSTFRSFFAWCHRTGRTACDVGLSIRLARVTSTPTRPAATSDVGRLTDYLAEAIDGLAHRDRALLALLVDTGIRRSEVLRLRVRDCDLERGLVRVELAKGEGRAARPLSAGTVTLVARYLDEFDAGGAEGPLFPGIDPRHPMTARGLHAVLSRRSAAAGLLRPITPHALRSAFASRLHDRTHDLLEVSRALGHRRVTSTARYVAIRVG